MSELLVEISKLSIANRMQLVQEILSTIVAETTAEATLTRAQIAALEERAAEIEAGLVRPVPWEQVQDKLSKRYGLYN